MSDQSSEISHEAFVHSDFIVCHAQPPASGSELLYTLPSLLI